MNRTRNRIAVAGAAALIGTIGVANFAAAGSNANDSTATTAAAIADDGDVAPLTQAEIDEINNIVEGQAANLRSHGFEATVTTDTDGLKLLAYDETNEAANQAFDEYMTSLYGDAYAMDEDFGVDPADLAENNAAADELAAYLTSRGVKNTVTVDELGYKNVTTGDDQATMDAIDDFYWQQNPLSADEIASINTDVENLVSRIIANGGQATATKDRHGVLMLDTDWESPATLKTFEQLGDEEAAANPVDIHVG